MTGYPSREDALRDFFEAWEPPHPTELVTLDDAPGRVSATATFSKIALPVYRASMCDGIAVRSADFADGLPDTNSWHLGADYVRADTGDDFDDAFDAVIMIEKAAIQADGSVVLDDDVTVSPGGNVNPAGSTIKVGDPLLEAGVVIRPSDLAALALGGQSMVEVLRRPNVAFIPTGSELVPAGTQPLRGQNIDTNSLMVKHMLVEMGAKPLVFPIVRDDKERLREAFKAALSQADIIIVNAGSAVGQEDFNVSLIEECGKVVHHYIAAVPGRPLMLAVAEGKPVVVLPGPVIAAYYGTDWCIRAVVARWYGVGMPRHRSAEAYFAQDFSSMASMANLTKLDLALDDQGRYVAKPKNFKGGQMAQALTSNAQRVSPLGEAHIAAGQPVTVELLRDTL